MVATPSALWAARASHRARGRGGATRGTDQHRAGFPRRQPRCRRRGAARRRGTGRRDGGQNRRLRRLLGGIAGVLVLALVAGVLAWRSREEAQAASVSADAQRLAATALNIEQPDVALLAAVEGTKLEQSPETYGALLTLLAPSRGWSTGSELRTRSSTSQPAKTVLPCSSGSPALG